MERTSRDCFNDGGALAEVMTLYERMDDCSTFDDSKQHAEVTEQGNRHLAIEARCSLHFFANNLEFSLLFLAMQCVLILSTNIPFEDLLLVAYTSGTLYPYD